MVASTVKNAIDHLRKGNNERKKVPQYLAYVPGVQRGMERGFWAREEEGRTLPPRTPLAFLSRSALKVLEMLNKNMN